MSNVIKFNKYRQDNDSCRKITHKDKVLKFLEENNMDYAIVINDEVAKEILKESNFPNDLKFLVIADNWKYNITSTRGNKVYYMNCENKEG